MRAFRQQTSALLLIHLSTLLWASNIVLGRALRTQIGPVTLTAARFSLAGLLFLLIIKRASQHSPLPTQNPGKSPHAYREWLLVLAMGLTGVFGFPVLLYLALRFTTASQVALINGLSPLLTMLLAGIFLRERITAGILLGGLISVAGVAVIVSRGALFSASTGQMNPGDLIALGIAALWGIYSVITRLAARSQPSLTITARSIWLALPLLLPAAILELQVSPPNLSPLLILAVIYIAIFPSVIAFLAWNEGVRRIGANGAMAFYNMLPVYASLLGVLFLRETLGPTTWLGGGLVIAGGILAALSARPSG